MNALTIQATVFIRKFIQAKWAPQACGPLCFAHAAQSITMSLRHGRQLETITIINLIFLLYHHNVIVQHYINDNTSFLWGFLIFFSGRILWVRLINQFSCKMA